VGTDKRARQKELHKSRAEQARKAQAAAVRRKRFINIGLAVLLAAAVLVPLSLVGNDDTETADSSTTTTPGATTTTTDTTSLEPAALTGPGAGAEIVGKTPCPNADGSSPRTTKFAEAPPMCIDKAKNYAATVTTNKGEFVIALDPTAAPETVNNFVVLARYGFYNGIPFHRIVPNFVIQGGDPSDTPTGAGGPGYTIGEEPPADKTYEKYDLAMAKTAEPNSTGSQFFVVTGDPAALNSAGTYSLFGTVLSGREVVDAIGATPTAGPSGDSPTEQITIEKMVITEQDT
jgi:cyclophilin family peptidyl-prolyl cis-trans isomerase